MKKIISILVITGLLFGLTGTITAQEKTIDIFISMPEYATAINQLIDAYQKIEPDVKINYQTIQSDYPTLLKVKLNSGDVPDIFASAPGKEIDLYKEYSYDLSGQPLVDAMQPAIKKVMADSSGEGVYGLAIKGNYFGLIYNKDLFAQAGIEQAPATMSDLETAITKLEEAGITPFTSGFGEWWVYKHVFQHFLAATTNNPAALIKKFENGEANLKDYPILYNNFFHFVDLVSEHGDAKPLEATLNTEIANFSTGKAAMMVGQGPWVEDSLDQIDPNLKIGFVGYPVSDNPAQAQVISGADQALRISRNSDNLETVLDFVNWWYTSDYGQNWFVNVAGVVPPVKMDYQSDYDIIKGAKQSVAAKGAGQLTIIYSTDSFHMAFAEAMQAYVGNTIDKDQACKLIENNWVKVDGSN